MVRNQSFLETGLIPILASYGLAGTQGKIIHVKPYTGSDNGDGGKKAPIKSLDHAQDLATANKNDIVLLYYESNTAANTTDYQSSALAWAKDGVHLIGVGAGPMIGQRARIAQASTVKTITDLFTVSANNCIIGGIEVYQGVASSTATYERAMVVSGMRNKIVNCQISGIGDTSMDDASSCSLAVTGPENWFKDCYIGLDTVIRGGTAESEINLLTSATRNIFDDCIINSYTSSTSFKAMSWAAGSYHTATWIRNCMFCAPQNRTSVAIPTGALLFSAAGQVMMLGGGVFGYADISTLTNANILYLGNWGLETASNYPGIGRVATPS